MLDLCKWKVEAQCWRWGALNGPLPISSSAVHVTKYTDIASCFKIYHGSNWRVVSDRDNIDASLESGGNGLQGGGGGRKKKRRRNRVAFADWWPAVAIRQPERQTSSSLDPQNLPKSRSWQSPFLTKAAINVLSTVKQPDWRKIFFLQESRVTRYCGGQIGRPQHNIEVNGANAIVSLFACILA